jgi:hypothetical protein
MIFLDQSSVRVWQVNEKWKGDAPEAHEFAQLPTEDMGQEGGGGSISTLEAYAVPIR